MDEQEQMLTSILNCRREELYLNKPTLTTAQQKKFTDMKKRRSLGEPLQYILGDCDFMGIKLKVDKRVLIPRPETEILVESVCSKFKGHQKRPIRVFDIGTGSGNIAIALAKNLEYAEILALDISAHAVALAEENAQLNHVGNKVRFLCGDIVEFFEREDSQSAVFDIIISNPPYIQTSQMDRLPPDVRQEPKEALDGGKDGLDFYRFIIAGGIKLLKPEGSMFFEVGDDQAGGVKKIFEQCSVFNEVRYIQDYTKVNRIVYSQLKG